MKICLYLEFYHFLNGTLFNEMGTGILSSYENQKAMLARMGIPFVEKWNDSCDILQTNSVWPSSFFLVRKAKKHNKKVIIFTHITAEDFSRFFRFKPLDFVATKVLKKYLSYFYGLADVLLCPSEYTRNLLLTYGLPERKMAVQSNGVDTDKFFPSSEERQKTRENMNLRGVVVGTVGIVIPRKGVKTFLTLAQKFQTYQFIWFGRIFPKLFVKPLPQKMPRNIEFTGYVKDINAAYNALDIFLFPSYEENQGMVLLEASAVGLPILVRDIPAYEGWLIHNENCLKAKTNEEFEQFLAQLIKDENLRKRLGKKAGELAEKHKLENVGRNLKAVYTQLLVLGL
ncbi:MAG: glycosyltransferase family 4 protein [bacterium]|nr:glycosyltransferase family 4 protein [bacterium]